MTKGDRIRTAREAKGITQEELGRMCGTTKQTIFKYESGTVTNIPLDRLEKLAEILGITPSFIMGWEEQKEKPPAKSGELSETDIRLIEWFRSLPPEKQKAILISQDAPEDLID